MMKMRMPTLSCNCPYCLIGFDERIYYIIEEMGDDTYNEHEEGILEQILGELYEREKDGL